jgi:hypothetical protein
MTDHQILRAGRVPMQRELLRRADAAVRRAGDLAVDGFWIRLEMRRCRAERLSNAAERRALAAHRLA